MKRTGVHEVIIGGAPARVVAYPGHLLVEVALSYDVNEDHGVLFFWPSVGYHFIDIAALPPQIEIALISNDGKLLEVHDPTEEPVAPSYPFVSAVVMRRGWFDRNCTSVRCSMNVD
ncbi:MAG: hypothetical protein KF858_04910 [Candidatus Sumerlaeia bacterium]|nr:hypothetical protein [Candidatus Sumerlaeia bacterium]